MTNIQLGAPPREAQLICEYFKGYEYLFEEAFTFKNFVSSARSIDQYESAIPKELSLDLHIDMILNQGREKLTQYHQNISKGTNEILEAAKKKLKGAQAKRVDEALFLLKKEIGKKLKNTPAAPYLNEMDLLGSAAPGVSQVTNVFSDVSKQIQSIASTGTKAATSATNSDLENIEKSAKNMNLDAVANNISSKDVSAANVPMSTPDDVDAALAGPSVNTKESSGVWGFIKKVWNLLTEDGNPWGILHLVLDVAGVIGDFVMAGTGIPLGAIFDCINAIIYFVRGKILLGTISLVAAFIFGAGDLLKLLKPGAKFAEPVMLAIMKKGPSAGAEVLAKVPAKESGMVMKLLRALAKNVGGAFGKAAGVLGKFFDTFLAKLVGWIPLIGKPLRSALETIGQKFAKVGEQLRTFSSGFAKAEKEAAEIIGKESAESIETMLKNRGQAMVPDGDSLKIVDKDGKTIAGPFPKELIEKGMDSTISKGIGGSPEAVAKYYTNIAPSNEKLGKGVLGALQRMKTAPLSKKIAFIAFVGKQVIKLMTNKDSSEIGMSDAETQYWGNSSIQSWLNDRISKERKEKGATYLPYVELNSDEKEVFDRVTNYQNNYAQLFGQPHIIPVVYDKYGKTDDEFKDFFAEIKAGKVTRDDVESAEKKVDIKDEKPKESNESLKYVYSFSKFVLAESLKRG